MTTDDEAQAATTLPDAAVAPGHPGVDSERQGLTNRFRWAVGAVTSTTLLGGLYQTLYQAAYMYYARLGLTPEQAGLSREALAGGACTLGSSSPGCWHQG